MQMKSKQDHPDMGGGGGGGACSVPQSTLASLDPHGIMPLCVSVEFLCLSVYQSVCLSN